MNEYLYEEIKVGDKEHFNCTITPEMMKGFKEISGDTNPLHYDEKFAKECGFNSPPVYGMLTSSFYSTLAGVYLPGKYCLLYGVDVSFRKPIFPGEELTVFGTVSEKNDAFKMIIVKAYITNQNNEKVSKATLKIGFLSKS